ncbi:VPA1267 family protein [Reinekea marinisedimentorum]|uniref:Uncharacterized protein n=1 Tax=Reinekea marinisedimentorum TaxID=230495 RepID=A0A4R3HVA7_9GAMM|nr:VPA1267 family protein [Reinekea marinisedimentorum]TCS36694.1 hypothetical protein BCF53_12316 [Reinekea marinisedimentorum]
MSNLNGQQKTQQNLDAFRSWVATQPDSASKQIIFRGQLGRGEIAKAIGCGKSSLTQNPVLNQELANLKTELRNKGVAEPQAIQKHYHNPCQQPAYSSAKH